jgi:hypothetical protein
MWSYDGMLVAPVIAFLVGVVYLQKKKLALLYLLCIPLYLWMRSASGALAPSGDYGYKVSTFFVNSISNTAGYSLSLVLGPQMIELWNSVRINLRSYIKEISIGMSITLFVISILTWKLKAKLFVYKKSMLWFLCYLVSLIAYIPLGGMAERYVYIPSIFALVGLTILVYDVWQHNQNIFVRVAIVAITAFLLVFNIRGVASVGSDWEKASSIVEQTLRVVKKEAFPPLNLKNFYIVNTPIRYGRAWVFPTGLTDAFWHIYRQSPYVITPVSSIEEGYHMNFKNGDREVFVYEDYIFKRGIEETHDVPSVPVNEKNTK